MNSYLRKMQSEMISKPWQRFSSVCASIDTEVDPILDRLLRGNKPHAYLLLYFLRSLIFKHNDTLCPCQSCHVVCFLTVAGSRTKFWYTVLFTVHISFTWVFKTYSKKTTCTRDSSCTILNKNCIQLFQKMCHSQ